MEEARPHHSYREVPMTNTDRWEYHDRDLGPIGDPAAGITGDLQEPALHRRAITLDDPKAPVRLVDVHPGLDRVAESGRFPLLVAAAARVHITALTFRVHLFDVYERPLSVRDFTFVRGAFEREEISVSEE
jgi:hypothetical protein